MLAANQLNCGNVQRIFLAELAPVSGVSRIDLFDEIPKAHFPSGLKTQLFI